jgi:hypothetical protein
MAIYYLDAENAAGFSGNLFNLQLKRTNVFGFATDPPGVTVSLTSTQTASGFAYTPVNRPGGLGRIGTYSLTFVVITGNSQCRVSWRVHRINSSGTIQNTSSTTAEQVTSAGTLTSSLTGVNLGTWAPGDRLMLEFVFRNNQNMPQSFVFDAGNRIDSNQTGTAITIPQARHILTV